MKKAIIILFLLVLAAGACMILMQPEEVEPAPIETVETGNITIEKIYQNEVSYKGRYHYTLLDDAEKSAYEMIAKGIWDRSESIKIPMTDEKQIQRVVRSVYYDFPEVFWFECSVKYTSYPVMGYSEIRPTYVVKAEDIEAGKTIVEEYMKRAASNISDISEYAMVKGAYEYIILHTQYDIGAKDGQTIMSVVRDGKSVCAGYAKTMCVFLRSMGFDCIFVEGKDDENNPHSWNIVKIGESYYHLDATWGDPVYTEKSEEYKDYVSYAYLLVTDEDIKKVHTKNSDFVYPDCISTENASYMVEETYFETYDQNALSELLKNAWNRKDRCISLKFKDQTAYDAAYKGLTEGGLMEKVIRHQMIKNLNFKGHLNYSTSEKMHVINIYFEYEDE